MITGPYWDERLMIQDHNAPEILAIGDSWFWYPNNNLLNPIFNLFSPSKCILAYGNNGAEAIEYVGVKYKKTIQSALDTWRNTIRAVIISGGGNDFAGLDDLFRIIRPDCTGSAAVDECFNTNQPDGLFDEIGVAYTRLIDMVLTAVPNAAVFLHNYDRAIPTGKGFAGAGNWLKAPMDQAHIDKDLQQGVVNRLLFEFTARLKQQAQQSTSISIVDSARLVDMQKPEDIKGKGTLDSSEWANELHPKRKGFEKIARRWKPVFKDAGVS